MSKYEDKRQLKCSFCGKSQDQVRRLIAGPNVYICDECVELCDEIIQEEIEETIEEDTTTVTVETEFDSRIAHNIKYENVYFGYEGNEFIQGVSLDIKTGQKIAIVGATGSGKSTLVSLLLKFYKVIRGNIMIDNININHINTKIMRDNISYVGQECILFNDTIKNNIALATGCTNLSEIIEAAQKATIHDFIMSLPNQYDTVVGDNGLSLSGGQRQCICLARAFLKNAPMFILDEATSALDKTLETKVLKSIMTVCEGKTLIIITHKLPSEIKFDSVYSIENGQIKVINRAYDKI